jgi:hypothetical protein
LEALASNAPSNSNSEDSTCLVQSTLVRGSWTATSAEEAPALSATHVTTSTARAERSADESGRTRTCTATRFASDDETLSSDDTGGETFRASCLFFFGSRRSRAKRVTSARSASTMR